jgi:SPW repeat
LKLIRCLRGFALTSALYQEETSAMISVDDTYGSNSKPGRDSSLDVYNLVLAVLLFISPWLFAYPDSVARIDVWASGALIALASLAAIVAFSDWEEWINLLLGLWLVVAPWVLGFAHTRAMHISIGGGLVVAFLAGLELWLDHYRDSVSP